MKLLLASQSPRRRELLESLGYSYETVSINVDEIYPENLVAEKVPAYLSELKSVAFRPLNADELLLTADTVVINNGAILGKPQTTTEARQMLLEMSGKTHQVVTSFSIRTQAGLETFTDTAEVELNEVSEDEANYYIRNFGPMDKAGAYGIQEWFGMAKIRKINGSFYTIMGLPTHLLYTELKKFFPLPKEV